MSKHPTFIFGLGLFVAALLFASTESRADSVLGTAGSYNAFIFNNLTASGGDTEGHLAVGGNATISSYGVGGEDQGYHPGRDVLVVGGNLDATNSGVYFGDAFVAGTTKLTNVSESQFTRDGQLYKNTSKIDFVAEKEYLTSLAGTLSALETSTGTKAVQQWGGLMLEATGAGTQVINMDASMFNNVSYAKLYMGSDTTLVVNVYGSTVNINSGFEIFQGNMNSQSRNDSLAKNVIFNFVDATSVTINYREFIGSMIGVNATINLNGGSINGNAIFASANQTGGGEFHTDYYFNGDIPTPEPTPTPATTPEPSTLAMFAVASLFTGAFARRRQLAKQ